LSEESVRGDDQERESSNMIPLLARRRTQCVLASLTLALATAATPAHSCDICAIYTGSLMQQGKTGLILGASEQFTNFDSIRVDDHNAPNPGNEWMRSSITQLVVGYQATPNFGMQANLPLISREYRRLEHGVARRGDVGGVGDLSILGRFSPVSRAIGSVLVHVELFAGIKVPTGDSDRLSEELGDSHDDGGNGEEEEDHDEDEGHGHASLAAAFPSDREPRHDGNQRASAIYGHDRASAIHGHDRASAIHGHDRASAIHGHEHASAIHGHDLALGTGSVDGVFGVALYADWKRLFGQAAVQYVVRGNGEFSYEYANDLTWEVGPGFYVVADHAWTGAIRFLVSGENKGRDHQKGELLDDTAITAVYIGPGLTITWGDSFHGDLAFDLPVEQDVTGRQIVADYRLRFGMGWRF